jgi:hypothetical protein
MKKSFSIDLVPYTASGCTTLFSKTFGAVIKFEAYWNVGQTVKGSRNMSKGQGTCQRSVCITFHRQPLEHIDQPLCAFHLTPDVGRTSGGAGGKKSVLLFPAVSRFVIDYGLQRLRYGLIDHGSKRPVPKELK